MIPWTKNHTDLLAVARYDLINDDYDIQDEFLM